MGTLYIVATPIGNLDDITIRAIKTLFSVAYIACEDTRVTGQLLHLLKERINQGKVTIRGLDLNNKPTLISYYDQIEVQKAPEIVNLFEQGHDVALVSDAGTPLLSDPGFKLVQLALKQGIKVVPIPGASAIWAALVTSGLPINDFRFVGYLPHKRSKRVAKLKELLLSSRSRNEYQTFVLLEAPQRVKATLQEIKSVFGDVQVVLARELTKVHEEFIRGKVSDVLNMNFEIKGEFIVLFSS